MMIRKVCVFCASSNNVHADYSSSADKLGKLLARSGREIIYGGGNIGLMGKLADGALSENGKVTGIIPSFLKSLELGHTGISELRETNDMHERESVMMKESDCIIALPGGCGTFSELLQAITWKHLGLIISPIIIINIRNYFSPLIEQLNLSIRENFRTGNHCELWHEVENVEQAMELLK